MLHTFTLTVYDAYQRPGEIFEMVVRAVSQKEARDLAFRHDGRSMIWTNPHEVGCIDHGPYRPTSRVVGTKRRPAFGPVVDAWPADDA